MYRFSLELTGTSIVLFALREIFSDIFHPTRSGNLSDLIGTVASKLLRPSRLRHSAGPIALIAVILTWVFLLGLGFALIYTGLFPKYFVSQTGELHIGFLGSFLHCLYFSLGTLGTFQTFDLNPQSSLLRLIVAVEGLIGIGMITASVSWLVLLYPALERTRQLALRVSLLVEAEKATEISLIDELGVATLTELSQAFIRLRLDLILFPILLHFYATEDAAALGPALPHALRFSRQGLGAARSKDVRLAAAQLCVALTDLGRTLAERVLKISETDTGRIFEVFSRHA